MIKETCKKVIDIILYGYNLFVFWLVKLDDKQRRTAQHKKENAESGSLTAKLQRVSWIISYYITPKKFSLAEQKDLVEMLRMSVKFKNSLQQPFEYMTQRKDLRLFVRIRCKEVYEELKLRHLHEALEGKKMLDDEYVALMRVAQEVGNFSETYTTIVESITEKQKRKAAMRLLMIQPVITLFVAVGSEIFVALYLIPQLLGNVEVEDLSGTVLSYYNLREILLHHKMEYGLKVLIGLVIVVIFFKIPATNYLLQVIALQIPFIAKYIAQWEISKFFNSINDMVKARSSMQVATTTALGLVNNIAIRSSLEKDLREIGSKTNDLGVILSDSVYVDLKVRNQLKITANSGGNTTDLLESIVDEYKDSMKKLLDAPNQLVIPVMLALAGVYLFTRLLPLFSDISSMMQNMG